MRADAGSTEPRLARTILEEPWLFDFFQLVRLLETRARPAARVGEAGPYRSERIRFRPDGSLAFSPADVRSVESAELPKEERRSADDAEWRIVVNFMGLYGVAAPTPVYFTELLGFSDVDGEPLTDFLDLFNHRIISFFFRAFRKYRYPYRYEEGAKDEFSGYLLSFLGLGEIPTRPLPELPPERLIRYLGLLTIRSRPAASLRLFVSDWFGGTPTEVEEAVFRWVAIPPENRNRLGRANCRLGRDLSVGEKVPDRSGRFRVTLGPLSFADYVAFLPGTERHRQLDRIARFHVLDRLDWEAGLEVRAAEIPPLALADPVSSRLGWTSWLVSPGHPLSGTRKVTFGRRSGGAGSASASSSAPAGTPRPASARSGGPGAHEPATGEGGRSGASGSVGGSPTPAGADTRPFPGGALPPPSPPESPSPAEPKLRKADPSAL